MTFAVAALCLLAAEPSPNVELRLAVVVGSNSAVEGRSALRFAHRDAESFASVLRAVGHFEANDVAVLLEASPDEVVAAVDAAAARAENANRPTLFVFYYSGHADDRALYPGGRPLDVARLKARIEAPAFEVRVGVIDSCRGGGWTLAKGLRSVAPFDVARASFSSEGTALLAASSGLEDAHEAEALEGSFFTHHLVAGLRGAADQSADGQVTLSEAFAYAERLTIRDTARSASQPQHPSFDLRLRGRRDLVLTDLNGVASLTVAQKVGPLQLVQLSTGVVVVEASPGEQLLRVVLPPGAYLLRRVTETEVRAKELQVTAGRFTVVDEDSLAQVSASALETKGPSSLEGRHELETAMVFVPSPYVNGWGTRLAYRVRLTPRLALRFRLLLTGGTRSAQPDPPQTGAEWTPHYVLYPSAVTGSDLEWLAWSLPIQRGGLAFGLSLGVGAMFYQRGLIELMNQGYSGFAGVAPAVTVTSDVAFHMPSLPDLAFNLGLGLHVGIVGEPIVAGEFAIGASWHFY